ncbi:MAG TPA: hybrid sensor histidine kinase/response regulator [Polyangiaceae bacterium]|nr:hybrid sensor histidine kinase/response regulator [Polyangiaceae bacterium]
MSEGPIRCLLVSERGDVLGALEEAVRAPDVEPRRARSCREALASAEGAALAIVDARAPGADGAGLAELARGEGRALPIVVLGGGAHDSEGARLAYEAGAVDVLFGPPDAPALRHKARFFFELERRRRRGLAAAAERAREAEAGRERAEGELREARDWHGTFVAIVGHDLRSPLNAILVGAQLVGRSPDENARRLAGHIGASGQRLSDLVDDLCDVARARQGLGFAVDVEEADLAVVVSTVVAELKAAHPSRALVLECRGELAGRFDRGAIARVASNLIGNALRHGSDEAPVDIRLEGGDGALSLEVENAGAIAPELVPYLFDPFRVAQETTRQGSRGLGLGLYISRKLVQAHGGELRVLSYRGLTRVIALVPKCPPAEPGPPAARARFGPRT